jgi:hypothetical protein
LDYFKDFADCNVLAYEYCGYSISDGEPTEQNCYECIQAAYDYLTTGNPGHEENSNNNNVQRPRQTVDPSKIVLFGRSLGTGTIYSTVFG